MDPNSNLKRNFSFPNADQYREQDDSSPNVLNRVPRGSADSEEGTLAPRRTVNIMDALANSKQDQGEAQTVRTYQSDIANTIKNDNVSMIKVVLAEKKRQEQRGGLDNAIEDDNKRLYLIAGGIIAVIVVIGLVAGYMFLQSQKAAQVAVQTEQQVQPLLYTEVISPLNIDDIRIDDLTKLIEKDKDAVMDLGSMKAIVLTTGNSAANSTSSEKERPLTTAEFFGALNSRAPDGLIRSLDPNYLLGVYAYNPRDMFEVFKVNSYDAAFAGMLEWEPSIESDIGNIFINKKERVGTDLSALSNPTDSTSSAAIGTGSPAATTTSSSSPFGVFSQRRFVDKILNNKDARVLVDSDGKEAMLYTFLDKNTLVISTSGNSLKEIIFRLTTGRIVR
jgi:hypothetical protein